MAEDPTAVGEHNLFGFRYTITEEDKIIFKELIGSNNRPIISSKGNPRFDKIYNDPSLIIGSAIIESPILL